MPEIQNTGNENPGLAPHLDIILNQVENKIASPETTFERGQHEREALHAVIGEKLGKESVSAPTLPPARTSAKNDDIASYDLPELKSKVDELLQIATTKDLDQAIDRVKKTNDPALLDAFHDALVDKLYSHLVSAGKLKQLK